MMKEINSMQELQEILKTNQVTYVLMIKKGSEVSDCAFEHYQLAIKEYQDKEFYFIDVNNTRDIHSYYQIQTVPVLLHFKGSQMMNMFKGCHGVEFFKNIIEGSVFQPKPDDIEEKPQKRVTIYTTPSCSWCNRLKSYLNKKGVRYTEINIAADPRAAEELVKRTGQQGVPQTEIDGEWVIGFDQKRIDQLLNL
ncbi:MAG: thioredoxin family protein [Bacteroidales bacterium]|nr:thioredoxin family protein [Bacteroidales bacterium]